MLAWHDALNNGDIARLLSLSTEDVEVGGPRGVGRGAELLRDWFSRAGARLEPIRWADRAETVVVEQAARWPDADGHLTEPQTVASVFRLLDGRVDSVVRYPDFGAALEAAGLSYQS